MDKNLINVAFIRKQQGIKGDVKISALLDNANDIKKLKEFYIEGEEGIFHLEKIYPLSEGFGLKFANVNSVDEALKLKNKKIYASRLEVDKLKDEADFYQSDLINKLAILDSGEVLGKITDIQNFGASDVIFISSIKYPNLCFANIGGILLDVNSERVLICEEEFNKVKVSDNAN